MGSGWTWLGAGSACIALRATPPLMRRSEPHSRSARCLRGRPTHPATGRSRSMDEIRSPFRSIPSWAVLAICCAAQFMVVLDVAIVNVALPQMRASLGLSVAGEQWVVNAYTLTFAGFLMLGGRAADLFGRRRTFIVGLGLFTFCSLIGGQIG